MSQKTTPGAVISALPAHRTSPEPTHVNGSVARHNRCAASIGSSARDFEGATPKISGVLGLHSENITKTLCMMLS